MNNVKDLINKARLLSIKIMSISRDVYNQDYIDLIRGEEELQGSSFYKLDFFEIYWQDLC